MAKILVQTKYYKALKQNFFVERSTTFKGTNKLTEDVRKHLYLLCFT